MAVWIIAAGGLVDKAALDNYGKTLSSPISDARRALVPDEVRLPTGKVYAWGFPDTPKGGNRRKVKDIEAGDICFFCTTNAMGKRKDWNNAYHWVAKVSRKIDPQHFAKVSAAFWDSEGFLPYLLEEPMPISLSFDEFSKSIDPSGNYYNSSPQSSTRLADPIKLAHVVSRYGSVDNWAGLFLQNLSGEPQVSDVSTRHTGLSVIESEGDSFESRATKFCSVEVRPAQALFRRRLFVAYQGKCVITGCSVVQALDAAHRHGRKWRDGHNDVRDGLLLRKDLHALYDAQLLRISEAGQVQLIGDALENYPELSGIKVAGVSESLSHYLPSNEEEAWQ